MEPGEASKLAGKLAWGCAHAFRQFGRANLRPIFDQVTRRDGALNEELRCALRWWITILEMGMSEVHEWREVWSAPAHLFTDASGGNGGHLGAVLLLDGHVYWTQMAAPWQLTDMFRRRADNQIMGLELLGIALGLSTFDYLLKGRNVVVHCDNSGAEV